MHIGAHVSSSGGIHTAIDRAEAIGAESVQVFTQSPRTWRPTNHDPATFERFRERRVEAGIDGVLCHALYLCNLAAPDDDDLREVGRGDAQHDGGRVRDRRRRRLPRRLPPRRRLRRAGSSGCCRRWSRCSSSATDETWLLMENSAGAGGTIGRSIEELAAIFERLDRHAAARRLPRLVPPVRLRDRRHRPGGARRVPRRAGRVDRPRPAARAARQRLEGAARLEPRPSREHRRRAARRAARRLPRQPAAAGAAGGARDGRARRSRPGRGRDPQDEGAPRPLDGATVSPLPLDDPRRGHDGAGELLRRSSIGLAALAPALRDAVRPHARRRSASCSARRALGMLLTLLPWGLLADRHRRAAR